MRKLALILLATLVVPIPAQSQPYDNYPVCLKTFGPVTYSECSYSSIAQCNASASGRPAQCLVNPFFTGAAPESRAARRHR